MRTSDWSSDVCSSDLSVPRTDYQVFYSYRHRSYFAVPFWYDETQVNRYTEGTLTVDLVEAAQNRLVWTGAAIGRVTRKDPQGRAREVDSAIPEIFLRYPFRAGSGVDRKRVVEGKGGGGRVS